MTPYVHLERRKEALDAEEQAAIKKEQWIDDETERLMRQFPDQLADFRHWRQPQDVMKCCGHRNANEHYCDFIWHLAHQQAADNYDLQILLGWEEPVL